MKKLPRWMFVRTIVLYGISYHWASVSTKYKLLMLVSKFTLEYSVHTGTLENLISSKCGVTLQLFCMCLLDIEILLN